MFEEFLKVRSLTSHLAELRKRLIISVIALIIGMGVTWNLSDRFLVFVEKPLVGTSYLDVVKHKGFRYLQEHFPVIYKRANLEHEFNKPQKDRALNYTAPLEPFFVQCKISILSGFVLVLPVIFYQIWAFVAPAIKSRERTYVLPFVAAASVAFCAGALFFLTTIWPFIINFSLSYETAGLQSWLSLSSYVDFCLRLLLLFGLIAELPLVTLLLTRLGILSYGFLAPKRKYALLLSSIVAAFHSDLVTMFVIMLPLYLMYEISVWVAFIFSREEKGETLPEPEPVPASL